MPECFAEDLFLEQLLDRCLWRGRRPMRSSASLGVRAYVLGVLGKPPTGEAVELSAIAIFRIEDGLIAERWAAWRSRRPADG